MSGAVVVDSSVVIAWQDKTHPRHADAETHLLATGPDFAMHGLNLAEVLVGLDEVEWPAFRSLLEALGFRFLATSPERLAKTRRRSGLKMPDACVLALAEATTARAVLTLDQRLASTARAEGFTVYS
ncbi:MAG: type II toxin-antitoxin system VapC family toxin [Bifidobacteriaceae bacterium]|nr:type II toxin-antitoxin system VapC family toxin [Bifidobacteriaceae bacterium]